MAIRQITMRAMPVQDAPTDGGHDLYVDCSECGPLGLVPHDAIKQFAIDHMGFHGVDAHEMLTHESEM